MSNRNYIEANEDEEREANYFAMCLLMPEEFLKEDVAKLKDKSLEAAVGELAKRYKVSEPMMTLRLGQLGFVAGG